MHSIWAFSAILLLVHGFGRAMGMSLTVLGQSHTQR